MENTEVLAGAANRFPQRLNPLPVHIAQEPQRQVKLLAPRPADAGVRQPAPKFVLRVFNFFLDLFGNADGDEKAEVCACNGVWHGVI